MPSVSRKFDSKMFDQIAIAMLSVAGLSTSMMMTFIGGFQIAYPWF